jgi:biotin carboxyl carrier protein
MSLLLTLNRSVSRATQVWSRATSRFANQVAQSRTFCAGAAVQSDPHTKFLKMPSIMNAGEGKILMWFKKEGESIQEGESVCQVEVGDLLLEIQSPFTGILADIRVSPHQAVKSDAEVGVVCDSHDAYHNYVEAARIRNHDEELMKELEEMKAEAKAGAKAEAKTESKTTAGMVLREVKHLLQQGKLDGKADAAFVSKLQALARKGHPELFAVFDASFEGTQHDPDTFDPDFFIENARALVEEERH